MTNLNKSIKIGNILKKLINYTYLIFIIYILIMAMASFKIDYYRNKITDKYNFLFFILGTIAIVILYLISNKISLKIKNLQLFINLSVIFTFIYLVFSFNNYYFINTYDSGGIIEDVVSISSGNGIIYKDYFEKYPNNLFILYSELYIHKFLVLLNLQKFFSTVLVLLNCLLISISLKLFTKILSIINIKKSIQILAILLFLVLVVTSPWVIVFYTDIIGMFFILLLYYLFLSIKNKSLNFFIVMFMSFIGYSIKPHLFFVLISLLIYSMINYKEYISKKSLFYASLGLIVSIAFVKIFISSYDFNLDKNKQMTYTHFLMMGHNIERMGIYNGKDVEISVSQDNVSDRETKNISVLKERIREYGFVNLLKFYTKKNLINYNDGTFAFYEDSSFATLEHIEYENLYTNGYKHYYYNNGKYNFLFRGIMQSFWLAILFISLFSFKDSKLVMFKISLLSVSIFLMLFECSSRYLLQFVPIFIICSMCVLNNIIHITNYMKNKLSK